MTFLRQLFRHAAVLCGCLLCPSAALAQSQHSYTAEQAIDAVETAWSDDEFAAAFVRKKMPAMSPWQAMAMRKHLQGFLKDRKVLVKAGEMAKAAMSAGYSKEQSTVYFAEAGTSLVLKGIGRLPDGDIEFFLRQSIDMMGAMSPEDCKRSFMDELSQQQAQVLENRWMSGLDETRFMAVLDVYRKAFLAEVNDYPAPRYVSREQMELAAQAQQTIARQRFNRLPDPAGTYRAIADMARANPTVLCAGGIEYMKSGLDLYEPLRTWALVKFGSDLAR